VGQGGHGGGRCLSGAAYCSRPRASRGQTVSTIPPRIP
jgi:hypothetical protein